MGLMVNANMHDCEGDVGQEIWIGMFFVPR